MISNKPVPGKPIFERRPNGQPQTKPTPPAAAPVRPPAPAPAAKPAAAADRLPDSSAQNTLLRAWKRDAVKVRVISTTGREVVGVITGHDSFSLIVEDESKRKILLLKHSIFTISAD